MILDSSTQEELSDLLRYDWGIKSGYGIEKREVLVHIRPLKMVFKTS